MYTKIRIVLLSSFLGLTGCSEFAATTSGFLRSDSQSSIDVGQEAQYAANLGQTTGLPLSSLVKGPTDDVTIPEGSVYYIDKDLEMGLVAIHGELRCAEGGIVNLKAESIMLHGAKSLFECGSDKKRFQGRLDLQLKEGRSFSSMDGIRALSVMGGGTLRFFGREKNFGFQRLRATVEAGTSTVQLERAADWSPGETLILGPTGFKPEEAERRVIQSVAADRMSVKVTSPFSYRHNGQSYKYSAQGKTWTLDERAEVAVLDRNIIVRASGNDAELDAKKIGAHIMVMRGSFAYVDGVEIARAGQLGVMGRYPFHWHWAGNVPGQFIRNSSIHDSYQRCVTIHGTNQATVENNVCFNHFGHGYFLENGNEVNNVLVGNLGMYTRRVPAGQGLLASDMGPIGNPRFSGPSTFWITHPSNTVRGNVASGAEGSGFWMAFSQGLKCDDPGNCEFVGEAAANVKPARAATIDFSNNLAHSAEVGHTWDGAEDGPLANNPKNAKAREVVATHYWANGQVQSFPNLVAYKNSFSGVYFRGESVAYPNFIGADNTLSLFFAYNQAVHDSLLVGMSPNFFESELSYLRSRDPWPGRPIAGALLYDGPFDLQRVHFADFPNRKIVESGREFSPVPFVNGGGANRWVNSVKNLTFAPEPLKRFSFSPVDGWTDMPWTTGLRDQDGSLTGLGGALIVPDHPLNRDAACSPFSGGLRCLYQFGVMTMVASEYPAPYDANNMPFTVFRSDGARSDDRGPGQLYNNKTGLVGNRGYSYKINFDVRPNVLRLMYFTEQQNWLSPVVELGNLGADCRVTGGPRVNSLNELSASGEQAWFGDASRVFVKMRATSRNASAQSEFSWKGTAPPLEVRCNRTTGLFDSGVFDEDFYRARYPDLAGLTRDQLLKHWAANGVGEGREASAHFNADDYLAMYPDLRAAFGTDRQAAILHFLSVGQAEGRIGRVALHPKVFDAAYYRAIYGDLQSLDIAGLERHWILHGVPEGRLGARSFSAPEYLSLHADVRAQVGASNHAGAIRHFVLHGLSEGRAGRTPEITGHLDGVSEGVVYGWACARGRAASVDVHVYAGGSAGSGTFVAAGRADLASDAAVAAECAASGVAYRFAIPLSAAQQNQFANQKIFVHGISPAGGLNRLLANSGVPRLGAPSTTTVYRFYQPLNGEHFSTASYQEGIAAGFVPDGVSFKILSTQVAGTHALYRCYAGSMHFVSSAANCEGQSVEGIYGYAYGSAAEGSRPLYRVYHPTSGDHMVTFDPAEGSAAGYRTEGVLGYVLD